MIVDNEHPCFDCTGPRAFWSSDCFHSVEFGQRCATDPQSAGFCLPRQAKPVQDKWSCGANSSDADWLHSKKTKKKRSLISHVNIILKEEGDKRNLPPESLPEL